MSLFTEEQTHRYRRRGRWPREVRGRGWSYHQGTPGTTKEHNQGTPGVTRNWRQQGRILPQGLWREYGSAGTLILDFWPPEVREYISVALSPQRAVLSHGSARKLTCSPVLHPSHLPRPLGACSCPCPPPLPLPRLSSILRYISILLPAHLRVALDSESD